MLLASWRDRALLYNSVAPAYHVDALSLYRSQHPPLFSSTAAGRAGTAGIARAARSWSSPISRTLGNPMSGSLPVTWSARQ
jgi:hypothetical protein